MMFLERSLAKASRRGHFSKRMYRLQLQGWFDDVCDKVKDFASDVKSAASSAWTSITSVGQSAFQSLKTHFTTLKDYILKTVKGPLVQGIKTMVECFQTAKGAIEKVKTSVLAIVAKVNEVIAACATGPGFLLWFGKFLIKLLCQIDDLKLAWGLVKLSWNATNNADRMHFLGQFLTKILLIFANNRRRRVRRMIK